MIDYLIGLAMQAPRVISPEFRTGGSSEEITIKKYADLLIVINPGRELYPETALIRHSSPENHVTNNDSRYTCVYFMFKLATTLKKGPVDRHHRWRIRLASGSKQAARATPTARSACFVPRVQITVSHSRWPFTSPECVLS